MMLTVWLHGMVMKSPFCVYYSRYGISVSEIIAVDEIEV